MEMTDTQLIQSVIKMQQELVSALSEISRLRTDMTDAKQQDMHATKPFFSSSEEEREQVMRVLFNIQKSGIRLTMSSEEFIQKRFGFTKSKSEDYIFEYIDTFRELELRYNNSKSVDPVEISAKIKRKGPKPYSEMTADELIEAKAKKASRDAEKRVETVVASPVEETVQKKKTILKLKKTHVSSDEPKPKGVLIWNAFMNMVKAEMMQGSSAEPSYNEVLKKALEEKEANPESYKLFSENWSN